ncbi:hypothetical protein scyTo_0014029, partial [Scyliorhinus torazame]|nr:hypothetical protein [Scyliorhinus torazame]
ETKALTMVLVMAWKQMFWFYYQYLLVTTLHIFEPWERIIFNSLLISIVRMVAYTGYVLMPQHIMAILHDFEIRTKEQRTKKCTAQEQALRPSKPVPTMLPE